MSRFSFRSYDPALLAALLSCTALVACGGGGGGGGGGVIVPGPSFSAFTPDACPGVDALAMDAGAVTGNVFEVVIEVNSIDDFFGAGFHVTFDSTLLDFLGIDTTGTILQGTTDFQADEISPGELAITATMLGTGAGIPNATGELVTLSFEALQVTAGTPIAFPLGFRVIKVCPTAGQACNEVQGTVTWCGGTAVAN